SLNHNRFTRLNNFRTRHLETDSKVYAGLQSLRNMRRMEAKRRNMRAVRFEVLPVLGQSSTAVEPGDRSLDDPALGQRHEAFRLIGSFDDLDLDTSQDFGEPIGEARPLIGAI